MFARSLFHIAPCQVECREIEIPALSEHQVLIESRYSSISPGTESMIFENRMPKNTIQDETIKILSGKFKYPFRYGYALVGTVVEKGRGVDSDWLGREIFAFHPHQDYAAVSTDDCLTIPEGLSALSSLFLANTEAALNFVMDANPNIGESVIVAGQGIVGLLTTAILANLALDKLIAADPKPDRRQRALASGATMSIDPADREAWQQLKAVLFDSEQGNLGLDVAFELSGTTKALNQLIELIGFSGKIVIGSWYGRDSDALDLSNDFHRRRIQLISSQVSSVNPQLSGRWDKPRRIALAWEWIRKLNPERFISHRFPLQQCQEAFELIQDGPDDVLQVIFEY